MKVTKDIVIKDYQLLKKIARLFTWLKFNSFAMDCISVAAQLMYNFNIIYTDDEFEHLLTHISKNIFRDKKRISNLDKNRIVFYDYFSLDNRGLTEQYLQALIDLNYNILYITLQTDSSKMQNIIKKINGNLKVTFYQVKSKNNIKSCYEIVEQINSFKPSKILFHSAPWDVVGFVSLCLFEGVVERFLINLTDHAYWLGKCCNDYFIEFRSYGANISVDHRNIDSQKILSLPFYPISNSDIPFKGFPFDSQNKKIIFSGGSLNKIYGSPVFFNIVKFILNKYEDVNFLYLGHGNEKLLLDFITENDFNNRFFFSQERKDVNEVFKRCYFYLGTYPLAGGLMSQLAVFNGKISISYNDSSLKANDIDELFLNNSGKKFTFTDINEMYLEIDKLLADVSYFQNRTKEMKDLIITKECFASGLQNCIENKKPFFEFHKYKIDKNRFSQIYFEQENNYLHNYIRNFLFKKNIIIVAVFIKYTHQLIIDKVRKLVKKSYDF